MWDVSAHTQGESSLFSQLWKGPWTCSEACLTSVSKSSQATMKTNHSAMFQCGLHHFHILDRSVNILHMYLRSGTCLCVRSWERKKCIILLVRENLDICGSDRFCAMKFFFDSLIFLRLSYLSTDYVYLISTPPSPPPTSHVPHSLS